MKRAGFYFIKAELRAHQLVQNEQTLDLFSLKSESCFKSGGRLEEVKLFLSSLQGQLSPLHQHHSDFAPEAEVS